MPTQLNNQMHPFLRKLLNRYPENLAYKLFKEKQGISGEIKPGKTVVSQEPKKEEETGLVGTNIF